MTENELLRQAIKDKNDFIHNLMNELRESYNNYDDILLDIEVFQKKDCQ